MNGFYLIFVVTKFFGYLYIRRSLQVLPAKSREEEGEGSNFFRSVFVIPMADAFNLPECYMSNMRRIIQPGSKARQNHVIPAKKVVEVGRHIGATDQRGKSNAGVRIPNLILIALTGGIGCKGTYRLARPGPLINGRMIFREAQLEMQEVIRLSGLMGA